MNYIKWLCDIVNHFLQSENPNLINVDTGSVYLSPASLPRGIRNNNPGNIRFDGTLWNGLADIPTDGEFCRFNAPEYGIRAMRRIIRSYGKRGLVSIEQIISTWAPPNENNTESYIKSVVQRVDFNRSAPLPNDKMPAFIAAIIHHENGLQPYTPEIIQRGINLEKETL